jgi:NADH-quinone oxidoreductase subunit J
MLELSDYLFYLLAAMSLGFGVAVVLVGNPIYSALCLALSMLSVAGIFATLDAWFVAGVQVIVYAGAVMVLFVMVLMLFDIKKELKAFSPGVISTLFKLGAGGVLLGLLAGSIYMSSGVVFNNEPANSAQENVTELLAVNLFTKYLFGFEAIGVLLLMVAVGAVALSRIAGGTHDREQL